MSRVILSIVLMFATTASMAAESARPNILFLFADDWGMQASAYAEIAAEEMGQAGLCGTGLCSVVRTPNFDRLAASGVLFTRAFVSAPSCTPCRSALLSGQHFWRTGRGAILRGATWDASILSYPLLLEQNGYHTGYSYKVWSPGTPRDAPIGGERTAYHQSGVRFCQFSQAATRIVAETGSFEQAKETLLGEVKANFRQYISARKKEQPFAYWFGPTNVHRKWVKGSGEALWGIRESDLRGKLPPFLPDVPEVRQDMADYLGEVQAFDLAIGVLIDELKRTGDYENTIIAVSGDHGPPGFPYGKCNLYDFGSRVALAIAGPGIEGGRVVHDLVSLPDLAPTFLEAGDVALPETMTAKSLWPLLKSKEQGWIDPDRSQVFIGRERHVENARDGNLPYPQRAIRTKDHLLIINFKPDRYPLGDPYGLTVDSEPSTKQLTNDTRATLPDEDAGPTKAWLVQHRHEPKWKPYFDRAYGKRARLELYDLKSDPHQVHNLSADPQYAEVATTLEKRLIAELRSTGDPRLVDEGAFFEEVEKFDAKQ